MHIRIKGYTFQLTEPYTQGTVLTKGEAQALNILRAENIQNNLRSAVVEALSGLEPNELLPAEVLATLQTTMTKYDLSYQFLEKHSQRPKRGDIELAIREVAEERVMSQSRQAGLELPPETFESEVGLMEQLPAVIEEARARVSARRRATTGSLADL